MKTRSEQSQTEIQQGEAPNSQVPCQPWCSPWNHLGSRGLKVPAPPCSVSCGTAAFLSRLHSVPSALLISCPMVLASPTSWSLQCSGLSGSLCRDSSTDTHCPAQWLSGIMEQSSATPSILCLSCLQSQYHTDVAAKFYCHPGVKPGAPGPQQRGPLCANPGEIFLLVGVFIFLGNPFSGILNLGFLL